MNSKNAISDLIEKITPKLSKSLYQKETNKRRLENGGEESSLFNYQQIIENGVLQKTIIYEQNTQIGGVGTMLLANGHGTGRGRQPRPVHARRAGIYLHRGSVG